MMIVGQFEEVHLEDLHQRERPWPVVLFQIEQRTLRSRLVGDGRKREDRLIKASLVVQDKQSAQRVVRIFRPEDFVFGIARIPDVRCIDSNRRIAKVSLKAPASGSWRDLR